MRSAPTGRLEIGPDGCVPGRRIVQVGGWLLIAGVILTAAHMLRYLDYWKQIVTCGEFPRLEGLFAISRTSVPAVVVSGVACCVALGALLRARGRYAAVAILAALAAGSVAIMLALMTWGQWCPCVLLPARQ